jgi:C_GCAxxG_C_C family probable redox protein
LDDLDSGLERDRLAETIGERAKNLYLSGRLFCSEAVLVALNTGLGGGIPDDVAIRLASALPVGLGGSGCVCGALSGAALAVGLFLGRSQPGSPDAMEALKAAGLVHERFKNMFGATCCRVLTKKVKGNSKLHFEQCAGLTGRAATMAAIIILERKPNLAVSADSVYLETRDSRIGVKLERLVDFVRHAWRRGAKS